VYFAHDGDGQAHIDECSPEELAMLENFVETKLRNSQGYSKYGEKISELISKVCASLSPCRDRDTHLLSVVVVFFFLFLSNNRDTTPTHKKSSSRDSSK
jgi:hypothetical protein